MHQLIIVLMSIVLTAVMVTATAVYTPASKTTTEVTYALVRDGFRTFDKAYQLHTKANNGAVPATDGSNPDGGLANFSEFLPFVPKAPVGYQWAYGYNSSSAMHYFCLYSADPAAANSGVLTAFTRVQKIYSSSQLVLHNGGRSNCGSTTGIDTSASPSDVALTFFVKNIESFSPKSIPGLVLWLDGDDAGSLSLNNGAVNGWLDKSGYGNNAVQGSAANMPTYSSTGYRGKGGLSFSRGNLQYLEVPLSSSLSSATVDLFVAGALSQSGGGSTLVSSNTADSCSVDCFAYSLRQNDSGGGAPVDMGIQYSVGTDAGYVNIEPMQSATAVNASALWEGVSAPQLLGVAQDVISNSANPTLNLKSPAYNLQLGRGASGVQTSYLDGSIGEVVMYSRALAPVERLRLQHYFGRKWSLQHLTQ